jgi:polysaccharide deacetylase family protein (PEP-CTERM system associated)
MKNVFTVDVEDYFHPTEVGAKLSRTDWDVLPSRVEVATSLILDLLEQRGVRGTFFVLGWVARTNPALVRKIAAAGHEIACHSHEHRLVYSLSPAQFKIDTLNAVRAIRDACGVTPRAYRAPSFSITAKSLWALEILAECGFTHDSSICPIAHDRYGVPGAPRHTYVIQTGSGPLIEVPVATVRLSDRRVAPVGGGAYLRLFPYRYTAAGIRRINSIERQSACIYVHPWEVDVDQPRIAEGSISRLRTYLGLTTVMKKLRRLLNDFEFEALGQIHSSMPVKSSYYVSHHSQHQPRDFVLAERQS